MKIDIYLLVIIISAVIINSCDSNEPVPPKPPGYQEDIPWPSLADSPWPMNHGDPQSTCRSKYNGPQIGSVDWEFLTDQSLSSGISLSGDSLMLFATNGPDGKLVALKTKGEVLWESAYFTAKRSSTPIVTNDKIYCSDGYKRIIAFSKKGDLLWTYNTSGYLYCNESIAIDKQGRLYFADLNDKLTVLDCDGKLLWELTDERINNFGSTYQMTFSPDGETLYVPGDEVTVLAINISTSSVKWIYGKQRLDNCAMVDSDGNIYLLFTNIDKNMNEIVSLSNSGQERWKFNFKGRDIWDSSPTLDKNGNIYFASDSIYSFDYTGKQRWSRPLNLWCDAPLVCDAQGNVYVGAYNAGGVSISAFNNIGVELWKIDDNEAEFVGDSPAIGNNGRLYYPLIYNKIFAIK